MARTGNPKPRVVAAALALVLAAALLALLATPPPADAAGRYKTVTKTFSNPTPIAIPIGTPEVTSGPATPYPSEVSVGGLRRGKVLDANLALKGLGHTYPSDVDVMVSHGGVNRTVMGDVGGHFDVGGLTLTLDDEAVGPMPFGDPLATGTFEPTNEEGSDDPFDPPAPAPSATAELSGFDGLDPNGPWRLWVRDDAGGDFGEVSNGWSVTIKARVLR